MATDQTLIKKETLLAQEIVPYLSAISTDNEEQQKALIELRTAEARDAASQVIADMKADKAILESDLVKAQSSYNSAKVGLEQAVVQAGNAIPYSLVNDLQARASLARFNNSDTPSEVSNIEDQLAQLKEMLAAAKAIFDAKFQ